ncbi:hypothetical protein [Rossellomorea aquimaris]|jgi:hypothetical protein|uniref:Uncharacterized protein n=1 Tax=Rossellomorea aquimaris TaxID=189382 RepID=A0A1J6VZ28_9BACI|nr:hypothetical protein [Rossellomorea aquimaris]OIU70554.1 hypothetical protein BHE18_18685 [Rossellomorea aquimaris]
MKQKLLLAFPFLILMVILAVGIEFIYQPRTEESIIFFPINENVAYESASTLLTLVPEKKDNVYEVKWKISSKLDTPAYLRQDVGFLFINGRLKGKQNEWEQDTDGMVQEKTIEWKESSLLEAVSFHYSEIHENDDTAYTSAQKMTEDRLYVIDSNFSPLNSFRQPGTDAEKEWKMILDRVTSQQLDYTWEKAIQTLGIPIDEYTAVPLTELTRLEQEPPGGFENREWQRLIGNLWEGLYKNYYLGIKKEDGTIVDSFDSTIPLILIKKDKKEVLVLLVDKDGNPSLLRQRVTPS